MNKTLKLLLLMGTVGVFLASSAPAAASDVCAIGGPVTFGNGEITIAEVASVCRQSFNSHIEKANDVSCIAGMLGFRCANDANLDTIDW